MDKIDLVGVSLSLTGFLAFTVAMTGVFGYLGIKLEGTFRDAFLAASLSIGVAGFLAVLIKKYYWR